MSEFNSVGNAMNFAKRFKAFECGVCHQPYQVEGDLQPRILDCGHTFCTRCMGEVSQVGNIQCPACMRKTQVEFGTQSLRINYAILEILEKQDNYTPKPRVPLCEACRMAEAQVYCEQCGLEGFRLCLRCSNVEHDRPSPIAKLHNPTALGVTTEYEARPMCVTHNNPLEFYCLSEKSLKCILCKQEAAIVESDVLAIPEAVSAHKDRLRSQLRHLQAYQFTIRGAMEQVKCILTELRPSSDRAMDCIRIECRALEASLQKRQAGLLSMVETEEKNRTTRLQYQQEHLAVAATRISKCIDFANVLLQKDTSEFLRSSDSVIIKLDETLRDEDKGLHKPLANTGLPVYLDTTFIHLVENFGVVGGGPIPKNIEAVHIKGSLYIQWDPPDMKVLQYEIERELINDDKHYLKEEDPQVTLYDGSLVSVRIIGLAPGCTYRFRIRSQNAAGWGMWSHTFSATYSNFPFEFTYCGETVETVIPNSGYYRFESFGAKADDGEMRLGGAGAIMCATFLLNANDYLDILCGGMSQKRGCCSGGAGGTFVSINGRRNPLIIAGGGGGTRGYEEDDPDGQPGNLEEEGGGSIGKECAMGGAAGGCGKDAIFRNSSFGYGGAGYNTNSTTSFSFVSGGESGECGGFGGGGAIGSFGGGGGGGYSGGGGGRGAGGGGCFVREDGMEVIKKIGHNGHGMLRVSRVEMPKEAELVAQHSDTLHTETAHLDPIPIPIPIPIPSVLHNTIDPIPIDLSSTLGGLSIKDLSLSTDSFIS